MKKHIFIFSILFISLFFLPDLTFTQNIAPPEWQQCTACHAMGKRLIGPDLTGVTERRSEEWLYSFIRNSQAMIQAGDPEAVQIWEEYNKVPMQNFDFSDEQIKAILDFIKAYDPSQPVQIATAEPVVAETTEESVEDVHVTHKPEKKYGTGTTQPTFIIFLILLIVAIIDLVITKVMKAKFIHIIIILVALFVIGEIVYVEARALGRQEGYSPDQPVWFSHKIHAGQNKIDCMYCHSIADESKSAGIPSTALCMNCHNVIKNGKVTGTEEIAKVIESYETGVPIEWIRVHNLPDHAWFSHAQHVNAGKLDCAECHGQVEEMDRIVQVHNLGMGWCINCHRRTEVQFKENGFYQEYVRFQEELKSGKRTRVTVDDIGGNNCHMCHY